MIHVNLPRYITCDWATLALSKDAKCYSRDCAINFLWHSSQCSDVWVRDYNRVLVVENYMVNDRKREAGHAVCCDSCHLSDSLSCSSQFAASRSPYHCLFRFISEIGSYELRSICGHYIQTYSRKPTPSSFPPCIQFNSYFSFLMVLKSSNFDHICTVHSPISVSQPLLWSLRLSLPPHRVRMPIPAFYTLFWTLLNIADGFYRL